MQYNKEKFLRYIQTDNLLKMVWADSDKSDLYLLAMFNTYVVGNSVAERAYEKAGGLLYRDE